jgi:D-glycerate 3-kinase
VVIVSPTPHTPHPTMTIYQELALQLIQNRQKLGRPLIQGIVGGQGTGKTTLAKALISILAESGYRTATLSLDDLYKTYCDRMALQQSDPRLIWRGPPGTHDVDLGLTALDAIRTSNSVTIPRFDKSAHQGAGDRTTPEIVTNIDILLFEGWFVGVRPIESAAFDTAPPPIITAEHKTFARDINQQLSNYLPLWERLDSLIVLYPQDYRYSLQWRKQAEHDMIATGLPGMTDIQIEEFVNYFWRALHPELFIKPLIASSELVDLVIEINADHSWGRAYQPNPSSNA